MKQAMTKIWIFLVIFMTLFVLGSSQVLLNTERDENTIIWCTVNSEEQRKCEDIASYLKRFPVLDDFGRFQRSFNLECNQTSNKDECMILIDSNMADLTTLDPGEIFVAGRYHSLVPIAQELYSVTGSGNPDKLYGVAVIRKAAKVNKLSDLRGLKACFAGVGTLAGWVVPIQRLMKDGGMEIVDCNNHVKSAITYFGSSCAVNSLSDKYNPLGDNSDKLCQLCGSDQPGVKCTSNDPFSGYEGALNCLMDNGEIAFLKHSTIEEYFRTQPISTTNNNNNNFNNNNNNNNNTGFPFFFTSTQPTPTTSRPFFPFDFATTPAVNFSFPFGGGGGGVGGVGGRDFQGRQFDNTFNPATGVDYSNRPYQFIPRQISYSEFKQKYELLCVDGSRKDVEDWRQCYWDEIPSHAVVTSSAKRPSMRERYQHFLDKLAKQFGHNSQNNLGARLNVFESMGKYGNRSNLLFQDATVGLKMIIERDQVYTKYLEKNLNSIMEIRSCPVGRMVLCVTSDPELTKCIKMRTALNAQLLKPEMSCHKAHSHINCMQAIRNGDADAAIFDAGDIYTAGYHYNLIPVLSEIYNLQEPEYYAVAVAYQGDPDTELTYLKGKYSCHSGIGHAAGWVIPMAYLITSGRMRNYGCDSLLAASQYFTKSCVPGALSNEYNFGQQHNNLCDLCHGSSYSYCSRDALEDFYGYTGAFRCLIEGGGQVAFVKHTTVSEITDGKRRETWARNTLQGDFELLCRDGTRAPVTDYRRCNLGKVKANALVIRGGNGYNETETKAIINLFLYAQQLYGRKYDDDFNFAMFYSPQPYSDLIFQDAAQQLRVIPPEQRNYRDYLGKSFLKARAYVDCRAGVARLQISYSVLLTIFTSFLVYFNILPLLSF